VVAGPPEEIVREKRSYTGVFLKPVLARVGRAGRSSGLRRRSDLADDSLIVLFIRYQKLERLESAQMTLGIAWVRSIGHIRELIVASDSRLSGGQFWDASPKIMLLPRSDCVISFAGDTNDAYPLMLQAYNAIMMFPAAVNRSLDVAAIKGHLIRVFNHSRLFISHPPRGQEISTPPDALFMLSGYSWRQKRFRIWTLHYDPHIERFTFRAASSWTGEGQEQKIIAFVGDGEAVTEAKRLLIEKLRATDRLVTGGLNMEPLEVLRDIIRSELFPSVGGSPQLVKIYEHMNAVPLGVYWPDRQGGQVTLLGRPLMDYEKLGWRVVDPDQADENPRSIHRAPRKNLITF
jgi:hypothetical protein